MNRIGPQIENPQGSTIAEGPQNISNYFFKFAQFADLRFAELIADRPHYLFSLVGEHAMQLEQ